MASLVGADVASFWNSSGQLIYMYHACFSLWVYDAIILECYTLLVNSLNFLVLFYIESWCTVDYSLFLHI